MNQTSSYEHTRLSIQLSLNGLSFCITDTLSQKLIEAKRKRFSESLDEHTIVQALDDFAAEYHFLKHTYESVVVTHINPLFNIVPLPLFNKENLGDYIKFNAQILASDELAHDPLESLDVAVAYIPFTAANNFIFEKLGAFEFKHSSSVHLSELLSIQHLPHDVDGYFHLDHGILHMTIIKDNKLLFHNHFSVNTAEDFLYYILFSLETLGIHVEDLQAHFYGEITEDALFFKKAKVYISQCSIFRPSHEQKVSDHIGEHDFDRISLNA